MKGSFFVYKYHCGYVRSARRLCSNSKIKNAIKKKKSLDNISSHQAFGSKRYWKAFGKGCLAVDNQKLTLPEKSNCCIHLEFGKHNK